MLTLKYADQCDPERFYPVNVCTKRTPRSTIPARCYLFNAQDEGRIYLLTSGACVKAVYTDADRAEDARMASITPICDGDIVMLDGKTYRVTVNGAFSDAGYLTPVEE